MMKTERPTEPFSESENPEMWATIVAWQNLRIEEVEQQRDKLLESAKLVNKYCCERYTYEGDRGGVRMPKMYQPDCIQASMELIAEIEATK